MKQKHYVLFIIEKLVYIDGFTNLELFLLFFLCDCILAKKINGYSGNLIFKQESILRRSKQAANLLQKIRIGEKRFMIQSDEQIIVLKIEYLFTQSCFFRGSVGTLKV